VRSENEWYCVWPTCLFPLFEVLPGGLFGLLGRLLVGLAQLGGLLLLLLGRGLGGSLHLVRLLLLGRSHWLCGRVRSPVDRSTLLGQSSGLFVRLDALDARVRGEHLVDEGSQPNIVLLLSSGTLRLVLLLGKSLVVSGVGTLVDLLVVPLERSPRIKVVPEVVEPFDLLLARVRSAEFGHGLNFGESRFADEDRAKDLGVFVGRHGFRRGHLVFDVPVDRVELPSSLVVGEGLVRCTSARDVRGMFSTAANAHPSGCT
jgi:hypothetical protein